MKLETRLQPRDMQLCNSLRKWWGEAHADTVPDTSRRLSWCSASALSRAVLVMSEQVERLALRPKHNVV